jgi:hypothetical protein
MKALLFPILALGLASPGWARAGDDPPTTPPPPLSAGVSQQRHGPLEVQFVNQWAAAETPLEETDGTAPPGDYWVRTEYLLWFLKGDHVPPLVTAGPSGSGAVLGQPGVGTVFGGTTENQGSYSGARFTSGVWLWGCAAFGVEGTYFFLSNRSVNYLGGSSGQPGAPDLGRPFVNAVTGQPGALLVGAAGVDFGYVKAHADTELQGAEALGVWNVCRNGNVTLDIVGGLRYQEVGEVVSVADAASLVVMPALATISTDEFSVRNHFYGGELGARAKFSWRALSLTVSEKVALGANCPNITIAGGTFQVTQAGIGAAVGGGVLAQPSNIGNHSADTFSLVNETTIEAGWQLNDCIQAFLGYSLLYASSVVRGGDVIDVNVNLNPAAGGPVRPVFAPRQSDFTVHGVSVGLKLTF